MKLFTRLEKSKDVWYLLIATVFFFLLRFPSLFEPYWYGDEAIYQTIGLAINHGRMLYTQIWDNKPPLLYVLYATLQSDQFVIRFASLLFGLSTLIIMYYLSRKLFQRRKASVIAASFFGLLFALPFLEGNIANAENFMLLPIVAAAYLIYDIQFKASSFASTVAKAMVDKETSRGKQNSKVKIFIAGGLLGVAFLFKTVAVFDFAAFVTFFLFINTPVKFLHIFQKRHLLLFIKSVWLLFIGFFLPIILTFFYFSVHHAFKAFIEGSFFGNVEYVGYANAFIFPEGLLFLKLLLLVISIGTLFFLRKHLSKQFLFIFIWLVFSLFDAFFSQRPYTHYSLVVLPSFSLALGLFFSHEEVKRKKLVLLSLLVVTVISLIHFGTYGMFKTYLYYQNFVEYITGKRNVNDYELFFDSHTPRDYALATFLRQHTRNYDLVFIWGNDAEIYILSHTLPPGKYTVAYHITHNQDSLKETAISFSRAHPRYVVILDGMPSVPFAMSEYTSMFTFNGASIYERPY